MYYLVCRADQLPEHLFDNPHHLSGEYYPRIVEAYDPEDAIDTAFSPEIYKPGGKRRLVVIELGEVHEYEARPVKHYRLERLSRTKLR